MHNHSYRCNRLVSVTAKVSGGTGRISSPKQIRTCEPSVNPFDSEDECMPAEITDVDKFVAMSAKSKFCLVLKAKNIVKLKLRTPTKMYTLKIESIKADEVIKKLKCEIQEL